MGSLQRGTKFISKVVRALPPRFLRKMHGVRRKHGDNARTTFNLNLIPRWKEPTADPDPNKQLNQGKGVRAGLQSTR